jgi:hypothetical protein
MKLLEPYFYTTGIILNISVFAVGAGMCQGTHPALICSKPSMLSFT